MANAVETMFSVREKPWHYEMTKKVTKIIQEAPTSYDALVAAGLNWEVESKKIQKPGSRFRMRGRMSETRTARCSAL